MKLFAMDNKTETGDKLHFTSNSLGKLNGFRLQRNVLNRIQTDIKLVPHLKNIKLSTSE